MSYHQDPEFPVGGGVFPRRTHRREHALPRIVIISASVGAGHDGAAHELARRLEAEGFTVDRHDFLDLLPARLGKLLSGSYHRLLTWAPSGYQRIYAATEHIGGPARSCAPCSALPSGAPCGPSPPTPPRSSRPIRARARYSAVCGCAGGCPYRPSPTSPTSRSIRCGWRPG